MTDHTTILKSLVGSRAHGLNRPDSDWDWRGVYVCPTSEILSLGYAHKGTQWIEGKEDFTNYEIGHFLMLASKANPSVLELLASPNIDTPSVSGREWGKELIDLLPYLYDPKDAYNAFRGYSHNQRKKMLEDKDGRKWKYSLAYIRTLYALIDLLRGDKFSLLVSDPTRIDVLTGIRDGQYTAGEIMDMADKLSKEAEAVLPDAKSLKDMKRVNSFLIDVRKAFW